MTVEASPLGPKCNLGCTYCYQNMMRQAGSYPTKEYDLEAMKRALLVEGTDFVVFGGEPLLVPLEDLIKLWEFGLEKFKKNGIQTNAALITPEHMEAFKKYNVHVGVSIDGPGELNDARRAGNLDQTREATEKSCANFEALIQDKKIGCSLIVTLHRLNALPGPLAVLEEWLLNLNKLGLKHVRFHLLEVDGAAGAKLALTEDEQVHALFDLQDWAAENTTLQLDIFPDMVALLRGDDEKVTCIWNACDPWTTDAVREIDGQGNRKNCSRTYKDGKDWLKADTQGKMRQVALYETPFEDGGCKDCRFFVACKGCCPGHAIDGDWRNRPRDCGVWMKLFARIERDLSRLGVTPVSKMSNLKDIETLMIETWSAGKPINIKQAIEALKNKPKGARIVAGGWYHDHSDFGAQQ